ncbi:interferon-induced protein 44-like isoform X2 [Salarias fasciatus]|uniref:interferon-induced protein 44-like isoform X2 n=1 Tax=Salarias fasciatus TaxID=181472 RepID=UPI0011770B1E|nr:interferon-induced protein 44-like isoform X2 [Salarias fasciatus]
MDQQALESPASSTLLTALCEEKPQLELWQPLPMMAASPTHFRIQRDRPGSHYLLVFSDTMGIERGSGTGAEVNEIKLILEGRIREGFKFNSGSPPSAQFYNANPTINDKVHVLVCVIPASMLDLMDERSFRKIKDVRDDASELGIPQVAILTKIDEACNVVQYNLQYVYRSYWLKKQMEKVSVTTGIPMHCIFPVRNYSSEIETDDDMDSLILSTMRKIIDYGEDFLNDQSAAGDDGTQEIALNQNMEHA